MVEEVGGLPPARRGDLLPIERDTDCFVSYPPVARIRSGRRRIRSRERSCVADEETKCNERLVRHIGGLAFDSASKAPLNLRGRSHMRQANTIGIHASRSRAPGARPWNRGPCRTREPRASTCPGKGTFRGGRETDPALRSYVRNSDEAAEDPGARTYGTHPEATPAGPWKRRGSKRKNRYES